VHILIAMPTADAHVHVRTLKSLMGTCHDLARRGITFSFGFRDQCDVATSRNRLVADFLAHEALSHLLFVDNDMEFPTKAVGRLIDADTDVVGAVYPKRGLDLARVEAILAAAPSGARPPLRTAVAAAMDYVVRPLPGDDAGARREAIVPVAGIGMGLTLIRRDVFTRLAASRDVPLAHPADGPHPRIVGFFDRARTRRGTMISDDYAFCERWRRLCDGEVYADLTGDVGHLGSFAFTGDYREAVRQRRGPG
jgi:hypothetical protein